MKKISIKILIVLIASGSFFIPQNAEAAITYVSSAEDSYFSGTPVTSRTVSIDIGTRTDGLLLCLVGNRQNSEITVTSATYAGVSMDEAIQDSVTYSGNYMSSTILYLADPTDGTNDLVVNFSANSNQVYIQCSWYDGANQTQASVLDQTVSVDAPSGTTTPSVTITPTEDNEVLFSHVMSESATVCTVGSGETLILDEDEGTFVHGGSYAIQTTASANVMDWSCNDDEAILTAASFKEAAAADTPAGPVGRPRFLRFGTLILLSGTLIIY